MLLSFCVPGIKYYKNGLRISGGCEYSGRNLPKKAAMGLSHNGEAGYHFTKSFVLDVVLELGVVIILA